MKVIKIRIIISLILIFSCFKGYAVQMVLCLDSRLETIQVAGYCQKEKKQGTTKLEAIFKELSISQWLFQTDSYSQVQTDSYSQALELKLPINEIFTMLVRHILNDSNEPLTLDTLEKKSEDALEIILATNLAIKDQDHLQQTVRTMLQSFTNRKLNITQIDLDHLHVLMAGYFDGITSSIKDNTEEPDEAYDIVISDISERKYSCKNGKITRLRHNPQAGILSQSLSKLEITDFSPTGYDNITNEISKTEDKDRIKNYRQYLTTFAIPFLVEKHNPNFNSEKERKLIQELTTEKQLKLFKQNIKLFRNYSATSD